MHSFVHIVVYEEMEDDGLRPAFSPIAIPIKGESMASVPATSQQSPILKDNKSDNKKQCPACHSRKHKRKEKIDESLEQFVARRKKRQEVE